MIIYLQYHLRTYSLVGRNPNQVTTLFFYGVLLFSEIFCSYYPLQQPPTIWIAKYYEDWSTEASVKDDFSLELSKGTTIKLHSI